MLIFYEETTGGGAKFREVHAFSHRKLGYSRKIYINSYYSSLCFAYLKDQSHFWGGDAMW